MTCQNRKNGHQVWCTRANAPQYIAAGHWCSKKAMHKVNLPVQQAWRLGATEGENVYVNSKVSVDTYPLLNPTIYPTTNPVCVSNYWANLCEYDEDDDDETVVISNTSCSSTCDSTLLTEDETDDESVIREEFCSNIMPIQPTIWDKNPLTIHTRAQAWRHIAQNGIID